MVFLKVILYLVIIFSFLVLSCEKTNKDESSSDKDITIQNTIYGQHYVFFAIEGDDMKKALDNVDTILKNLLKNIISIEIVNAGYKSDHPYRAWSMPSGIIIFYR